MPCQIAEEERREYLEGVVIEALSRIHPIHPHPITTLTLLGAGGLNHLHVKRNSYRAAIALVLMERGDDCLMGSLQDEDFTNEELVIVADVVDLLEKDIV
ncbi:hypothetical protein [Pseudoduganella armeniaca]|nr:hypothetical protein [Pseudoduganella armeniaca]